MLYELTVTINPAISSAFAEKSFKYEFSDVGKYLKKAIEFLKESPKGAHLVKENGLTATAIKKAIKEDDGYVFTSDDRTISLTVSSDFSLTGHDINFPNDKYTLTGTVKEAPF